MFCINWPTRARRLSQKVPPSRRRTARLRSRNVRGSVMWVASRCRRSTWGTHLPGDWPQPNPYHLLTPRYALDTLRNCHEESISPPTRARRQTKGVARRAMAKYLLASTRLGWAHPGRYRGRNLWRFGEIRGNRSTVATSVDSLVSVYPEQYTVAGSASG